MYLSKHTLGISIRKALGALCLLAALGLSACGGGGGGGADAFDPTPPTLDDPAPGPGGEDGPTLVGTGSDDTVGDTDVPSGSRPDTLEESLKELATLSNEKRRYENEELPDSFGPMGSRWEYSRPAEVFVAGIGRDAASLTDDLREAHPLSLQRIPAMRTPWMYQRTELDGRQDRALTTRVKRDFVAADVDGDGAGRGHRRPHRRRHAQALDA